jgi:hypothetical protein
MLGLDFIPTLHNHEQAVYTHVTTYSKHGKEIFYNVVNTLYIGTQVFLDCKSYTKARNNLERHLKAIN